MIKFWDRYSWDSNLCRYDLLHRFPNGGSETKSPHPILNLNFTSTLGVKFPGLFLTGNCAEKPQIWEPNFGGGEVGA